MSVALSSRAGWRVLLAAMLGASSASCDDVLGLEELHVEGASSGGAWAGGSGGSTSSSVGGGATGGTGGTGGGACAGPAGPELLRPILDPLAVAVGTDRVFWIERTVNISTLDSRDACVDDYRTEALTNRDPAPFLSASGEDACWVTSTPTSWQVQCGNNANNGNDLDEYTQSQTTVGDVALTANGVYWLEQPDDGAWSVQYAARGALNAPVPVYEAGVNVTITAIAASADVVAWLEYDRTTAYVVTAPATGTSLQTEHRFESSVPYKALAVFGKRVLYANTTHVRELDLSGGGMPELDYQAGSRVLQVAFDEAGDRFALATDNAAGPWFVIQVQDDAGGPKVADTIVDPRGFAVNGDAVYYLQAKAGAGIYRQAR